MLQQIVDKNVIISIQALYDYKRDTQVNQRNFCQFQFKHCTIISPLSLRL